MTEAQRSYIKSQVDQVVALELTDGRKMLAQILVVVDEGDTPDMFCLEVAPTPSGYVVIGQTGHSILLDEIVNVEAAPEIKVQSEKKV